MWIRIGLALLAAAGLGAPAAAQTRTATFEVGGTKIALPLPEGYCEPSGKGVDTARFIAAADATNVTDLTLFPCESDGSGEDYYLIKTPKAVVDVTIGRVALLQSLKAEFDKPDPVKSKDATDAASDAYSKLMAQDVAVTGAVEPLKLDETCGYLGGVLKFATTGLAYQRAVSGCITAVGDRVVMVFRYSKGEAGNVRGMLPAVKALALSMRAQP